ncbi:hypothetical protein RCO22_28595 [Pseudomonas yamanorum]|uniref:Uncharacterized protein n=1 Tax=Pseudomonas yamanorum TaxID=515393 RepID=A0ABU1D074_9PSED|nr:hypothetical protein [Pseudomonas yamanorum]MDR0192916.1 hypothetical protein [Pseudomonas yamanorum]
MAICKETKADSHQLVTLIKMVEAYEAQTTHGLASLGNDERLLNRIKALLHKHDGRSRSTKVDQRRRMNGAMTPPLYPSAD